MKAVSLGLFLSLAGGVAWAQTGDSAATGSPPQGVAGVQAPQSGGTLNAPAQHPDVGQAGTGAEDPYQGEIIQTPNGSFMVAEPPQPDRGSTMTQDGNDGMQSPDQDTNARRMNPHPQPPMPSKAAHFRIKGPGLALDIKCPDDEPVKACVDAASQLIDKAGSAHQ